MSGERTHSATPRRRQEARKKGQVRKSHELSYSLVFLGLFLILKYLLPSMLTEIYGYFQFIYSHPNVQDLTVPYVQKIMNEAVLVCVKVVAPFAGGTLVLGFVVNYVQVGSVFSLKPLTPDLQRINPVEGFKRLVSVRLLVELAKSLLKLSVLSYLIYSVVYSDLLPRLPEVENSSLTGGVGILGEILASLTWKVALVFITLGVADYLYQWWEYERSLKMSHQELKEEFKNIEGNPQLKGEIKRRQRAMAMRRMMQDVPKADFVVTNPTHFSVAVRYDAELMNAPVVVAKGQDEIAYRIRQMATEHKVPLIENPPLARSLYRSVEIGQPVPPQLYKAVAEVLAFVYRINRKKTS